MLKNSAHMKPKYSPAISYSQFFILQCWRETFLEEQEGVYVPLNDLYEDYINFLERRTSNSEQLRTLRTETKVSKRTFCGCLEKKLRRMIPKAEKKRTSKDSRFGHAQLKDSAILQTQNQSKKVSKC